MKKNLLFMIAAVFACMVMISCNDEEKRENEPIPPTLANSVACQYNIIDAEGSYDGVALENLKSSKFIFEDLSDNEVSLFYIYYGSEIEISVSIPVISLSGVPYNVTFDHSCTDAMATYGEAEYKNVSASIKGWLKKNGMDTSNKDTRFVPAPTDYLCDIDIECTVDGKILHLRITGMWY